MTIEKEIELPGRIIIYIKYFRKFF